VRDAMTGFLDRTVRVVRYSWFFVVAVGVLFCARFFIVPDDAGRGLRWVVVGYAAFTAAAVISVTGFWRRWLFWRRPSRAEATRLGSALNLVFAVLAGFALTEVFVYLTSVLYLEHHVTAASALERDELVGRVEQHYVWQLTKELPVLDPTDFGWNEPAKGLTIGGWLAAYKLMVAIPVVGIVKLAYDRQLGNINREEGAGAGTIRRAVEDLERSERSTARHSECPRQESNLEPSD
jgi:hypothetical protein